VPTLAEEAVDAIKGVYGRHPHKRAAHAKGTLCRGTFRATADAAVLTKAVHMQGDPVEVTVRFSNSSGDPDDPDYARDLRGMATKFALPDGSATDLLAVTLPSFVVRTPEEFVTFTRASRPGLGRAFRVVRYLIRHREARRAFWAMVRAPRPASYASCRYDAVHTFEWIGPEGERSELRCRWIPEAGEARVSRRRAKRAGRDGLKDEIAERLARGEVVFTLQLELRSGHDRPDDPTAVWSGGGRLVTAGRLELQRLAPQDEEDRLVFDPTRLTDGIELSADPILRFRPQAYEVSVERRSQDR
jgi:catalase